MKFQTSKRASTENFFPCEKTFSLSPACFTLIELLVVIAIIAILANNVHAVHLLFIPW